MCHIFDCMFTNVISFKPHSSSSRYPKSLEETELQKGRWMCPSMRNKMQTHLPTLNVTSSPFTIPIKLMLLAPLREMAMRTQL